MQDISELREKIDAVDKRIIKDVWERMEISGEIGKYKKSVGMPILDNTREREKLAAISTMVGDDMNAYFHVLFALLFELSRSYQNVINDNNREKFEEIKAAIDGTPKMFPKVANVACQGVEGAYSTIACEHIFTIPNIRYCNTFEDVFVAVDSGQCEYGILPIENSTAGSVKQVYDLMVKYRFYIVRSTRIKVNHSLMVRPGTELKDVREIYSHEQAISQCAKYISLHCPTVKLTEVENTALAAQMVADSDRKDLAAISSDRCAELYGLEEVALNIADNGNNHTRFICISKKPEIYPGADKTSFMMIAKHRPGSLYRILARFYALNINITKLESIPLPDRDFDFMFYFDLDTSIYSDEFVRLMCDTDDCCESAQYLGSYSEVL